MRISLQSTSASAVKAVPASSQQPVATGFKDAIAIAAQADVEALTQVGAKGSGHDTPVRERNAKDDKNDHANTVGQSQPAVPDVPVVSVLVQPAVEAVLTQPATLPVAAGAISSDDNTSFALKVTGTNTSTTGSDLMPTAGVVSTADVVESAQSNRAVDTEIAAGGALDSKAPEATVNAINGESAAKAKAALSQAAIAAPDISAKGSAPVSKINDRHETNSSAATAQSDASSATAALPANFVPAEANAVPPSSGVQAKPAGTTVKAISSKATSSVSKDITPSPKDVAEKDTLVSSGTQDKHRTDGRATQDQASDAGFQNALKNAGPMVAAVPTDNSASAVNIASMSAPGTQQTSENAQTPSGVTQSATATDHAAATASAGAAGAGYTAAATPALSSAQLVQSMHGSEMRIGMHSDEFGSISVNTSLTRQTLATQITIDHSELGKAMAMHIPAMQEKLGNTYGIQTRVEVRDNGSASAGDAERQSGGNARGQSRASPSPTSHAATGAMQPVVTSTALSPSLSSTSTRLDIRI